MFLWTTCNCRDELLNIQLENENFSKRSRVRNETLHFRTKHVLFFILVTVDGKLFRLLKISTVRGYFCELDVRNLLLLSWRHYCPRLPSNTRVVWTSRNVALHARGCKHFGIQGVPKFNGQPARWLEAEVNQSETKRDWITIRDWIVIFQMNETKRV